MKSISIETQKRSQFINITYQVDKIARDSKIKNGSCLVFCPHTTAGLTINENADPDVVKDITTHLDKLVPQSPHYAHIEGNSDSHIKASLMGSSLNIIIDNGNLLLGTWQGIYFCEFDGPRKRTVQVKIIGK